MRPSSTISHSSILSDPREAPIVAEEDGKLTGKKLVVVIISIVCGLALLAALFAGAIVGIVFYSIGHSEATKTAQQFLRSNERLKKDIGEVQDFGTFVTGNINTRNNNGVASLSIKVIGSRRTTNARVDLIYMTGRPWRVTGATYEDEAGRVVDLLDKDGPPATP